MMPTNAIYRFLKPFIFTVVLCFSTPNTLANDLTGDHSEALSSLLSRSAYFQADFRQVIRDADGRIIDEAVGGVWLSRPNKLRWDIAEPLEQTLIVSDDQFFQYDKDIDQLIIEPLSDQLSAMPVVLLSGDASAINKQFVVKQIKAVTAPSGDANLPRSQKILFTLKPLARDGLFQLLTLEFVDEKLQAIAILDDLEQTSRFEFSAINVDNIIDDALFELVPPEYTDIIYR